MNRIAYQQLLNDYAEFHERQTTMDCHHQLKGAILDAVDEGLIERDPTRKAIIKGCLLYTSRSESAREKIILLAQGISRYNISKNKVMEIAVSLPSLDEQKLKIGREHV